MGWDPWSTSAHAQVRQLHLICLRHGPGHASKTSWASTAMTCQAELVLLQIARCPNDLTTEICSVSQQLPVLPTMRRCLHCNANCTCPTRSGSISSSCENSAAMTSCLSGRDFQVASRQQHAI